MNDLKFTTCGDYLKANKNFTWLSKEFSDLWIARCRELYDHAVECGEYKELHMKYILTPTHMREYYIERFPWLNEMPMYDPTKESVVFFRFNGSDPETDKFEVHKDPTEAWANVNVPVYNCTHETRTIWVEPVGESKSLADHYAGSKTDPHGNETFSEHLLSAHREIETQFITDRACLFKGDTWHKVQVDHNRDEWRVMAKFWSRQLDWNELHETFIDDLDYEYDNSLSAA